MQVVLLILLFVTIAYSYPYYPTCGFDLNCTSKANENDCYLSCCCNWCGNSNNRTIGYCINRKLATCGNNTLTYSCYNHSGLSDVILITIMVSLFVVCLLCRLCVFCCNGK